MKTQGRSILRATTCALALFSMLTYPLTAFAGNNISVQVICKPGVGVSNADVKLYRVEANGNTNVVSDSRTDKKGMVQIRNFESGTYELRVICSGGGVFTHKFFTGGAVDFSHDYLFRCCPPPPGAPPNSGDGLIEIDGKPVTDAETARSRAGSQGEVVTAQGLHRVTFDTLQGRVIVNLPDDMRAGDTISGTVYAGPKGQTKEERAKNLALLGDYFYVNPGRNAQGETLVHVEAATQPFTVTVPDGNPGRTFYGRYPVDLKDSTGQVIGTATVPLELVSLSLQSVAPLNTFQLPTIGQQGRPMVISGPFPVNGGTTLMYGPPGASVQDFEKNTENVSGGFGLINPIAQSPRKCVFEAPTNVTGPIEIYLKEGNVQTKGTYRNVGVNLTAPKTSLLKGESTELHCEVIGLQGITKPVRLTLESHGVITKEGGPYEPLVIQPSQVGADGRYSTTRGITGVQTGAWGATATVMIHQFDFCLQDDSNPRTVVLVNSFTGNYLFPLPGGTSLSGTGTVTRRGCIITLTDRQPDRSVQGQIDPCTKTAGASVTVSPKVKFTIIDRNTTNNTCAVQ